MTRCRFRGVRAAVDRLDAHLLHQRGDVEPPGLQPFSPQKPLQHPASGKRVVEMKFVDPPHQGQIAVRYWTRRIIDAATTEPEKPRLAHDRQFVFAVDHFFPLSNPALPSAPAKKSFSSVSSPILACSVLTSTVGAAGSALASSPKTPVAPSRSWSFHCLI